MRDTNNSNQEKLLKLQKSELTIELQLPQDVSGKDIKIRICNLMGQIIKIINPEEYGKDRVIRIKCIGEDEVGKVIESGTYILSITTPEISKSIRIV